MNNWTKIPSLAVYRTFLDKIMEGTSSPSDRAVVAPVFNDTRQDCGLTWDEAAAVLGMGAEDVWRFDRLDMDTETAQRAVIAAERLSNPSAHDKMRLAAFRAKNIAA